MSSILLTVLLAVHAPQAQAPHDRAYWQSIKDHGFAVPAGASSSALARELTDSLASSDPELRDALASAILTNWIGKKVLSPLELQPLVATWTANLTRDVGAVGDNSVLRRSYSALALADVATRDAADPFLTAAEHARLLAAALAYLDAEKDVRGFDDRIGWLHSAAHTADLLRGLSRSRHLTVEGQRAIRDGIAAKMRHAPVVFTFGEDERYARALGVTMIRDDFDLDGFRAWVTDVTKPGSGPVTAAGLRARQNITNLLAKLGVLLARQPTLPPAAQAARDAVLAAVRF